MIWQVTEPGASNEAEKRLWAGVANGVKLDLEGAGAGYDGGHWPVNTQIRAEAVVTLLTDSGRAWGRRAALWVEGAHITGLLDLHNARIEMPLIMKHCLFDDRVELSGARAVSISLEGSRIPSFGGYGLQLDGDFDCSGYRGGQIDIFGARIGGRLWLTEAELDGADAGYALNAPDLMVGGGMYCRRMRAIGGVNLFAANIGSALDLDGATLSSRVGPALRAPGLSVKADLYCGNGFTAIGSLALFGAQIGGQVWLNNAHLDKGEGERALDAPQIAVTGGLYCNGHFTASGMINLFGAAIGSTLEFDAAHLSNPEGMCLRAPHLTVKTSVSFTGGFTANGEIDLSGSEIPGKLALVDTTLGDVMLDLRGAHIGELGAEPRCLPAHLRLNGLTYAALQPYLPAAHRLEMLRRDEDGYQPQPYEQLAACYRALGYDEQARAVLLAKQRNRRQALSLTTRAWGYLQDAATGYGYRPARALGWLIVLVALAAAYFAVHPPRAIGGSSHLQFQPIIYAFYTVIPFLNLAQPNPYLPDATGQWIVWIAQLAGWTLATAVIAGVTRVLSRG